MAFSPSRIFYVLYKKGEAYCLWEREWKRKKIIKESMRVLSFFFFVNYFKYFWAGIAQSVQRLATIWTVRGSNPGGSEIFRTCPDRPWGPPSLLYNAYRVFPGGKQRPGRDADPSPPSSAVGHERVELYLYFHYGPYGLYRVSVPVQG